MEGLTNYMTDNRLPILKDAAMKALMAIADVGMERSTDKFGNADGYAAKMAHLYNRTQDTGKSMDERLEEAHNALQEALRIFVED